MRSSGTPGAAMLTITPSFTAVQGGTHAFELSVSSLTNAGASLTWPNDNSLLVRNAYIHYEVP